MTDNPETMGRAYTPYADMAALCRSKVIEWLPEGRYLMHPGWDVAALRIEIASGEQRWWDCAIFPALTKPRMKFDAITASRDDWAIADSKGDKT